MAGHSGAKGIQTALADLEAGGWWENEGKGLEEKVEACQREYERALAEFKALSSKVVGLRASPLCCRCASLDQVCGVFPSPSRRLTPPVHAGRNMRP